MILGDIVTHWSPDTRAYADLVSLLAGEGTTKRTGAYLFKKNLSLTLKKGGGTVCVSLSPFLFLFLSHIFILSDYPFLLILPGPSPHPNFLVSGCHILMTNLSHCEIADCVSQEATAACFHSVKNFNQGASLDTLEQQYTQNL